MDLQGFPAMTSYSSKSETGVERRGRISLPDSRSRSYTLSLPPGTHNSSMRQNLRHYSPSTSFSQDQYPNSSTPVQSDPPKYPKSSQCTLNNYACHSSASYLDELAGDGVHTNATMGEPRYLSSAEAADTYRSNFDVRTSSNLPSTSLSQQHGSDEHVSDYRSLRGYPRQDFEQNDFGYRRSSFQPLISDDLRHGTINGTGFLSANQAMSHTTNSRRSSATTSDRVLPSPVSPSQEQSRVHHRHSQHHQHQYAPYTTSIPSAEYITSYTGSSAAPRNTHSSSTPARPYQTRTSSSILMVNTRQLSQNANEKQAQASLNYALANNLPESQSQQYQSSRLSFVSARFDRPAITHSHSSPELRVQSASNASLGHLKSTHSPSGLSDNESATGSDYAATHDNDDDYERFRGGRAASASYSDGKLHSTPSDNLQGRNGKRILTLDTEATSSMGAGDPAVDGLRAVKKKKSKMHECTVCHKKFPRPSGLKTHMNTHNNEKPFPCGFPGCPRTFGVRSNAKRHLRTHGVQPLPASATRTEPPYVVGFQPPVTFPPQNPGQAFPDGLDGRASSGPLLDGADKEKKYDPSSYEHGIDGTSEQGRSERPVKLKWMPLSLMSRTNTSSLREVQEGHSPYMVGVNDGHAASSQWLISNPWSEGNDEGYYQDRRGYAHRPGSDTSSKDIEYALSSTDYERGGPYSDMTAASRLRIPLRSAYRSRSAEHFSRDSDSMLGASSMSGTGGCHCNPQCPRDTSGLMRCCSGSVASGSSSFRTSSGFDSASPRMLSRNTSEGRKLNIPELEARAPPSGNDSRSQHPPYQEPSHGSYPYHPSQFHGLPGPAPTSVVVLPLPYMMV